jgi:prepilin-type N-terminal cleavage/methylation domain-containing protein
MVMIAALTPAALHLHRPSSAGGFTLLELLVASGVFLIVATTTITALCSANNFAVKSRIQASAQALVQSQIDQIFTRGPYVPTNTPPDIPPELTLGTTSQSNIAVFTDPATGMVPVRGTRTITIRDAGFAINGTNLHVRQASVVLSYSFRSKTYIVAADTLRAPDQ